MQMPLWPPKRSSLQLLHQSEPDNRASFPISLSHGRRLWLLCHLCQLAELPQRQTLPQPKHSHDHRRTRIWSMWPWNRQVAWPERHETWMSEPLWLHQFHISHSFLTGILIDFQWWWSKFSSLNIAYPLWFACQWYQQMQLFYKHPHCCLKIDLTKVASLQVSVPMQFYVDRRWLKQPWIDLNLCSAPNR